MAGGEVLGVDCAELWHAGQQLYPAIASEFDTSASDFSAASSYYAFLRSGDLGVGTAGAYHAWAETASVLDSVLAETGRNLRDTGNALILAANTYAATDAEAQAAFDRRKQELG